MRVNMTLVRCVRGVRFWGYAYLCAVQQINVTGGYADAFGHESADVSTLAPFGSLVAVRLTSHHKNEPRAALCVYLGQCTHGGPGACYVAPLPAPGTILEDLRLARISASVVFVAAPGERVADATIASNMHRAVSLVLPTYAGPLIAAVDVAPDPPFNMMPTVAAAYSAAALDLATAFSAAAIDLAARAHS